MPKFRKKPVVIEARRFSGDDVESHELARWCGGRLHLGENLADLRLVIDIPTLEGTMRAEVGDWIIRGVKGEFYSCKPDIFVATYEPVEESVVSFGNVFADLGFPADEAVELRADELAALLDTAPPALTPEPAEAPGAKRCATCVWWGDGDDRRVDVHGIEIAPCHHPRSPVDEYPDGTFGCVLHEDR